MNTSDYVHRIGARPAPDGATPFLLSRRNSAVKSARSSVLSKRPCAFPDAVRPSARPRAERPQYLKKTTPLRRGRVRSFGSRPSAPLWISSSVPALVDSVVAPSFPSGYSSRLRGFGDQRNLHVRASITSFI